MDYIFLNLTHPASRKANPNYINKTIKPEKINQKSSRLVVSASRRLTESNSDINDTINNIIKCISI